jgi:hypothetical protein
MKRALGLLCAGLLLAGAGCEWNLGNTRVEADVTVNDQSIDAAIDEAAAKVQKELQKRGLEATISPDGDGFRVVAKAKSGDQFAVLLSRGLSASGREQTRIRIEWGQVRSRAVAGPAGRRRCLGRAGRELRGHAGRG